MKSIAFTDQSGERHIIYTRTEEALDALIVICEEMNYHHEINPEDA